MKNITGTITNDLFQHGANHIGDTNETNTIMSINERLNEISHYLGILSQHSYVFHDQINSANQSLLIQSQQLDMIQKTSDNTAREVFAIDKRSRLCYVFNWNSQRLLSSLPKIWAWTPHPKLMVILKSKSITSETPSSKLQTKLVLTSTTVILAQA